MSRIELFETFMKSEVMPANKRIQYRTTLKIKDRQYEEVIEFAALKRLKQSEADKYKQIVAYIQGLIQGKDMKIKQAFKNFLMTLPFEYKDEERIKYFANLERVEYKKKKISRPIKNQKFKPRDGQITLVQFWTSWNGLCLKSIHENLNIFEQYENINYVAMSMDDSQEDHQEGIKEIATYKYSQNVIHYRFMDGWDPHNVYIRGLKIVEIPFILILDEKQQIYYKGHPRALLQSLQTLTKGKTKYQKKKFDEQSRISGSKKQEATNYGDGQLEGNIEEKNEDDFLDRDDSAKSEKNQRQDRDNRKAKNEDSDIDEEEEEEESDDDEEDSLIQDKLEENDIEVDAFDMMKVHFEEELHDYVQQIESNGLSMSLRETQIVIKNEDNQIDQKSIDRSKIIIKYELPTWEKENVDAMREQIKEKIEEDYMEFFTYESAIVEKGSYIDTQQEIRNKIVEIFSRFTKVKKIFFQSKKNTITWTQDSMNQRETPPQIAIKIPEIPEMNQVIACKKEIDEYIQTFDQSGKNYGKSIMKQVLQTCKIQEGMMFQAISDYEDDQGESIKIESNTSAPLLIFYFNSDLSDVMRYIIRKNRERKEDKFMIFGINLEFNKDERDNTEFNDSSTRICYPKNKELDSNQFDFVAYGFDECPHMIIVDTSGCVVKSFQVQRYDQINLYLEGKLTKAQPVAKQQSIVSFTETNITNMIEKITALCQVNKLTFGDRYCFSLTIVIGSQVPIGQSEENALFEQIQVSFKIRDFQLPVLAQELDHCQNVLMNRTPFIYTEKNIIVTKSILNFFDESKQCAVCDKHIGFTYPQYYSYFKHGEYVCEECAEYEDVTKEGYERFKYTDALTYINAPLSNKSVLEHIEEYKFGKNLKKEFSNRRHDMSCNGCGTSPPGARYICISCRPGAMRPGGFVDFCCECFQKLKKRGSEEYLTLIEKNKDEGMTEDFLLHRVLFSTSYNEY